VLYTCLEGFAGHLVKPIQPEMVDALLEGVVRQRPRQPSPPPATRP
jgi:hypothetical protein